MTPTSQPLSPLAKSPSTEAERVVASAASVAPRMEALPPWNQLVAQAIVRPRRDWRLIPAFALSAALGSFLVLMVRPTPLAPRPLELTAAASTVWRQESDGVLRLTKGRLSLDRAGERMVRIETPHVSLEARRSRFLAEVVETGTWLFVNEGEVVLRAGGQRRLVMAGESVLMPPAPQIPQTLLKELEEGSDTGGSRCPDSLDRRACLEAQARDSTLDAQATLFELGLLEVESGESSRAIGIWESSLERFPEGVLHPEVRLKLLVELVRERRFVEAAQVALDFERACPGDPRLQDVRVLRDGLVQPSPASPQ